MMMMIMMMIMMVALIMAVMMVMVMVILEPPHGPMLGEFWYRLMRSYRRVCRQDVRFFVFSSISNFLDLHFGCLKPNIEFPMF